MLPRGWMMLATSCPCALAPTMSTLTPRCSSLASTNLRASSPCSSAGCVVPVDVFVLSVEGVRTRGANGYKPALLKRTVIRALLELTEEDR